MSDFLRDEIEKMRQRNRVVHGRWAKCGLSVLSNQHVQHAMTTKTTTRLTLYRGHNPGTPRIRLWPSKLRLLYVLVYWVLKNGELPAKYVPETFVGLKKRLNIED